MVTQCNEATLKQRVGIINVCVRGLRLWQKLAHFQPSTFAIKGIRSNWGWLNPITNHFFNNFQRRGGQKDKNSGTGNLSLFSPVPLVPEYFSPLCSEVNVGVDVYCCRWPQLTNWVGVMGVLGWLGGTMKSARWRQLGCLLVTGAPPPAAYRSPQPSPPAPHHRSDTSGFSVLEVLSHRTQSRQSEI